MGQIRESPVPLWYSIEALSILHVQVRNIYTVDFDSSELEDFVYHIAIEAGFSPPCGVTIPCDKLTGRTKGFAFIDFPHEEAAIKFMEVTKGVLRIHGGHFPITYYRTSDTSGHETDWTCLRCQFVNFSKRDACKTCGVPKSANIPIRDMDDYRIKYLREATMRTLELCPGLVPEGEKYYTDDQDRLWLFDPDTLYWYNKRQRAYYRQSPDNETALRRVDDKGAFLNSKDIPLPARKIPTRDRRTHDICDESSVRKRHRAEMASEHVPLTEEAVVINPSELTTCLLCSRSFSSIHALKKHENLSELHRDNLRKQGDIR